MVCSKYLDYHYRSCPIYNFNNCSNPEILTTCQVVEYRSKLPCLRVICSQVTEAITTAQNFLSEVTTSGLTEVSGSSFTTQSTTTVPSLELFSTPSIVRVPRLEQTISTPEIFEVIIGKK